MTTGFSNGCTSEPLHKTQNFIALAYYWYLREDLVEGRMGRDRQTKF